MEKKPRYFNFILWLAAVGFFMQTLDATIVNTALPSMAASLGESPLHMQSVVIAYALTMAMAIPASGWLADRFGTRLVFTAATLCFVAGSLACALSSNLSALTAARVLQGLGGAMLMPVGRLAVLRSFPGESFLRALSFVAIPGLIGPLVGPTLGGWLVETASWHWIFLINLPIGLLGCVLSLRYMPDGRLDRVPPFDFAGFALLSLGMMTLSLALDGLAGIGLGHGAVLVLLLFGLANLVAYWLRATRHPQPLFSPLLFRINSFGVGLLGNLFARIGSGAMPYLIPLLLQLSMGYSPFYSGMMMLPVAAAAILSKPLVTVIIQHFGYRRVLLGNTFLLGIAMAAFSLLEPGQPIWPHIVLLFFFGAVNSVQFTAMNTVTLKDLETVQASSGNSMLSMVQMLSMSLGVSVGAALLAVFTEHYGLAALDHLAAFHATFLCVGVITIASALIFWQLAPDTGKAAGKRGRHQSDDVRTPERLPTE